MFSPELKKGSIDLLVLSLLEERESHGYELGKAIEARSGGRLVFRISSLYPVLSRLEERRWIRGRWVEKAGTRRRRYYQLTASGGRALQRERATWQAYVAAVDEVLEPAVTEPAGA
ncbi:MAG TPA: PadR family transcriptional regulator [Thermoanaerobaculia bacterium]|nr:PadR family transcriptional regulator [Thermoanaerobaculia bacterium]